MALLLSSVIKGLAGLAVGFAASYEVVQRMVPASGGVGVPASDTSSATASATSSASVTTTTSATTAPLRPPGAVPEAEFRARCIRCGKCAAACPYQVVYFSDRSGFLGGGAAGGSGGGGSALFTLNLSSDGSALEGTPRIHPTEGACRLCESFPCIAACPSGALVPVENRRAVRMGVATLDRERCIALKGMRCEVCHRVCPLIDEAISIQYGLREGDRQHAIFEPVIHADVCVGCGICEERCVIQDPPAIWVIPTSQRRDRSASEGVGR